MKKRTVALALAFVLCFSMIPRANAIAVDSGAIARWDEHFAITRDQLTSLGYLLGATVQSDYNYVMWSVLDASFDEAIRFYASNDRPNDPIGVTYEVLKHRLCLFHSTNILLSLV